MAFIKLTTFIYAPIETCFNLARSIDAHQLSASQTKEKAISGKTTGLINKGETVTWQAVHFGIKQKLSVRITELKFPYCFTDEMITGAFKKMHHTHRFTQQGKGTLMVDEFYYETPLGWIGKLFDKLILKNYMTTFLGKRNSYLKQMAESNDWEKVI